MRTPTGVVATAATRPLTGVSVNDPPVIPAHVPHAAAARVLMRTKRVDRATYGTLVGVYGHWNSPLDRDGRSAPHSLARVLVLISVRLTFDKSLLKSIDSVQHALRARVVNG